MYRFPVRGLMTAVSVVGLATITASCASSGSGGTNPVANAIFGQPNPGTKDAIVVSANNFGTTETCPPVSIRAGTEQLQVFQPGKKIDPITGQAPPVVYQASITDTARECHKSADGLAIRIGIRGRVVAGPAGKPGSVTVPIRVVAVDGDEKVVKSELDTISVTLDAPTLSADFNKIDDSLDLPILADGGSYKIYVGFDDKTSAAPTKAKRKH